jgi:hypothetical protein
LRGGHGVGDKRRKERQRLNSKESKRRDGEKVKCWNNPTELISPCEISLANFPEAYNATNKRAAASTGYNMYNIQI